MSTTARIPTSPEITAILIAIFAPDRLDAKHQGLMATGLIPMPRPQAQLIVLPTDTPIAVIKEAMTDFANGRDREIVIARNMSEAWTVLRSAEPDVLVIACGRTQKFEQRLVAPLTDALDNIRREAPDAGDQMQVILLGELGDDSPLKMRAFEWVNVIEARFANQGTSSIDVVDATDSPSDALDPTTVVDVSTLPTANHALSPLASAAVGGE